MSRMSYSILYLQCGHPISSSQSSARVHRIARPNSMARSSISINVIVQRYRRCNGTLYRSGQGGNLVLSGVPRVSTGSEPVLGAFEAISASWRPVQARSNHVESDSHDTCSAMMRTEIRYFSTVDAFVFLANFSTMIPQTNATSYGTTLFYMSCCVVC